MLISNAGIAHSQAPGPDDFATKSQIEDFNAKLQSTPAFMWMVSADNTRTTQIDAGRAYVRVQLAATAHGLAMHPLQQALQEYPEQAGPYRRIQRGRPKPREKRSTFTPSRLATRK